MATSKKHIIESYQRERVNCAGCGENITIRNSTTASHCKRVQNPRCGPCYLKHKADERKRKGLE